MGLDASTSTTGIAIIDYDSGKKSLAEANLNLVHHEFFKPPKKDGKKDLHMIETLFLTKKHIIDLVDKYNPDDVVIEEYIMFMKGQSGAKTIIPLAVMNRTVGLTILEKTNKMPTMLNVLAIRHAIKHTKKLPSKEQMPEVVAKHLGITFPYVFKDIKSTKKKQGYTKLLVENEDMADAMAVALAYIKKIDQK